MDKIQIKYTTTTNNNLNTHTRFKFYKEIITETMTTKL